MKVRWYGTVRPKRRWNRLPKELVTNGIVNGFPEPELKEQDDEWHGLMDRAARILSARRDGSMARPELDSRKIGYK